MLPNLPELLAAQLEQRAGVLLSTCATWSVTQAALELHPGGPSGDSTLRHLVEMTESTLNALGGSPAHEDAHVAWPEVRARFEQRARELAKHVRASSELDLKAKPSIPILPEFEQSLSTRLAFLQGHIFHLGYHAGQLGSLAVIVQRASETGS
jgi:hypothetical protein